MLIKDESGDAKKKKKKKKRIDADEYTREVELPPEQNPSPQAASIYYEMITNGPQ